MQGINARLRNASLSRVEHDAGIRELADPCRFPQQRCKQAPIDRFLHRLLLNDKRHAPVSEALRDCNSLTVRRMAWSHSANDCLFGQRVIS